MELILLVTYLLGLPIFAWISILVTKEIIEEDPSTEIAAREPFYWLFMALLVTVWPVSIIFAMILKLKGDRNGS